MNQIGRAIPRLEAPHARSPGARTTSTICACPACSTGRSSAARSRMAASCAIDVTDGAREPKACSRSSPARTSGRSFPIRITARPSTISRSWRSTRCAMSARRSPSCSPPIRMSPSAPCRLIAAEYDELPPVFDEVEAVNSTAIVHDELKPAGTFADLKHLARPQEHQCRARLSAPARRCRRARWRAADHVLEHVFKTQQMHAHAARADRRALPSRATARSSIHSSCQTPSFVRMEIARLFGWPENRVTVKVPFLGGGFGAKVYVKAEALARRARAASCAAR